MIDGCMSDVSCMVGMALSGLRCGGHLVFTVCRTDRSQPQLLGRHRISSRCLILPCCDCLFTVICLMSFCINPSAFSFQTLDLCGFATHWKFATQHPTLSFKNTVEGDKSQARRGSGCVRYIPLDFTNIFGIGN